MKILAIDGNSIMSRAFYGIKLMTTTAGEYTNAIYGFLSTFLKNVEELRPDAVCCCFDVKAPTYRKMEYAAYKAGRRPTPREFLEQIPLIKEILAAMGVQCCEMPGYEADDLLGTVSQICEDCPDCTCYILTGDRDSFQLAGPSTTIRYVSTKGGKTGFTDYTPETVADTYGVSPELFIDIKALMGDSSDNIPGVAGIGEKTAMDLVGKYGGIDDIYAKLDTLPLRDSVKQKLRAGEDSARMSRRLAEIDRSAPLCFDPRDAVLLPGDEGRLYELLRHLELRSFINKFDLHQQLPQNKQAEPAAPVKAARKADAAALNALLALASEPLAVICAPALDWFAAGRDGDYLIALDSELGEAYGAYLRRLMSPDVPKTGHDIKATLVALMDKHIPFGGYVFDSAVACYLENPATAKYSLNDMAALYLGHELPPPVYYAETAFSALADVEASLTAIGAHLEAVEKLRPLLLSKLEADGMTRLMTEMELPLTEVLAYMQHIGVKADGRRLAEYGAQLGDQLNLLENQIYTEAGMKFNINSPKQLGEVLFEHMQLPYGKKTKSGYSTDVETLRGVARLHPIGQLLIDYRQISKLKSTYTDALGQCIAADGRIHSTFNQLSTATGRISSADPNLQNIPVRQERGAELRRMFVAEEGYTFIDADYSQIELRVLAHISGDVNMRAAFAGGADIHRMTAASVEGVAPEDVTPAMRSRAKAVNFGLVYGMSDFTLAQNIGITRHEATEYIKNYFAQFPLVQKYMEGIKAKAKEDGYVTTLSGRRRLIPELRSTNFNVRSFGERVALNTPIQGTAADIIKLAMVAVYRRLRREGLKSRLVLQVHDELIVEAAHDEAEYIKALVNEEMINALPLEVALVADAGSGEDWYTAKN